MNQIQKAAGIVFVDPSEYAREILTGVVYREVMPTDHLPTRPLPNAAPKEGFVQVQPTRELPVSRPRAFVQAAREHMTVHSTRPLGPRVVAGAVAVVSATMVWALWQVFVGTAAGQRLEQAALEGATYGQGDLWRFAKSLLQVVSVGFVVVGLLTVVVIALVRKRWGLAVQAAIVVIGANVSAQGLKYAVFGRENLIGGYSYSNALPSGHTTVAASVSIALMLVVPRAARPLVALLGATYTVATGVSTLVGQWHRPSDVVAACFLVLAWTAGVCAFTPRSALDGITATSAWSRFMGAFFALVAVLAVAVVAVILLQISPVAGTPSRHEEILAYVAGVFSMTAAGAVLFGAGLGLRQTTARAEV